MDLTIGSKHFHVSLLALLAVAIGLVWWFARADGVPLALDRWLAAGRQEVRTNAKYRWDLRALSGQVAAHRARLAHLSQDTTKLLWNLKVARAQSESLARWADSVHATALAPAVRRVGEACGELADNCEHRVLLAMQVADSERAIAALALARAARGDSLLTAGLHVADCRWLLFKCPSRTTVAEASLVTGVVITLLVHH